MCSDLKETNDTEHYLVETQVRTGSPSFVLLIVSLRRAKSLQRCRCGASTLMLLVWSSGADVVGYCTCFPAMVCCTTPDWAATLCAWALHSTAYSATERIWRNFPSGWSLCTSSRPGWHRWRKFRPARGSAMVRRAALKRL